MKTWIILGLTFAAGVAACTSKVAIVAETTGTGGSSAVTTTGTGASGPGGTSSSTGAGGSTGTGAPARVVTAETDIGQAQQVTVKGPDPQPGPLKVLDGPFFITDAFGQAEYTTVSGGDCTVASDQQTRVLSVIPPVGGSSGLAAQVHGIRLPILLGQTLCIPSGVSYGASATVLGFKPY